MNTELQKEDLQEEIKHWKGEIEREENIYNSLWDIVGFIEDHKDDGIDEDDAVARFCTKTLMTYFDNQFDCLNNNLEAAKEKLKQLE